MNIHKQYFHWFEIIFGYLANPRSIARIEFNSADATIAHIYALSAQLFPNIQRNLHDSNRDTFRNLSVYRTKTPLRTHQIIDTKEYTILFARTINSSSNLARIAVEWIIILDANFDERERRTYDTPILNIL